MDGLTQNGFGFRREEVMLADGCGERRLGLDAWEKTGASFVGLLTTRSVVLPWGTFYLPMDIGQYLETFLGATTGGTVATEL